MHQSPTSHIKDIALADQGMKNIAWAEQQMGALMKVQQRFAKEKPLKNLRIGIALHPTKETAVLVKTLIAGGADVAICACNPLSTQDDVAAALAKDGVKIFAWKGQNNEEYYANLQKVVEFKPQITIDDGCDLVTLIHQKHPELIPGIIGGCEETTTGVVRLKAMEKDHALKYPVVALNESATKHLMDNVKGTGQSTIDGILRATNILIAGKNFVICGYGDCGKGLAARARADLRGPQPRRPHHQRLGGGHEPDAPVHPAALPPAAHETDRRRLERPGLSHADRESALAGFDGQSLVHQVLLRLQRASGIQQAGNLPEARSVGERASALPAGRKSGTAAEQRVPGV